MTENKIIAHTLIKVNGIYLVIKRSKKENVFPLYWDIPGGLAKEGELPKAAAARETKEEVNLRVYPTKIIHEDSNLDIKKNMVFVRLVYLCELISDFKEIKLDLNEHSEYKLISSMDSLKNEKVVPYLAEILKNGI